MTIKTFTAAIAPGVGGGRIGKVVGSHVQIVG